MKKTVLLAAVALMGMCGGAMASSITVQLSDFCDEYTLTNSGSLYAIASDSTTCDPGIGGGTSGKAKGLGKIITTGMILNGTATEQYVWTFTSPLKKGGTASLYYTTDGVTLNFLTSSPFTVVTGASLKNRNLPAATQAAHN